MSSSLAAACAAIAVLPIGGCSRPRAEGSTANAPPTVAVATVTRGDLQQTLTVAAAFRPFQEIEVHSKVAGFLKSIKVDVGDRVQAGQLIAVLEIPEMQDELQQDEATIKRAQAEVNRADADLTRSESVRDVAHLASTRLSAVLKVRPNLIAQQDIDEASGRDRVAEAQVATAKAAAASSTQQLEIAKASQNKTKTLLGYSQITAPFAGVITQRYADTGAMIQAGTASQTQAMPLVRLSQNSRLRLVIPVPESAVSRIRLGAAVTLGVQALHKTFTGTVARFADRLDTETRTMRVEVDVLNPMLEIVPGMYADVSLQLEHAQGVLVAPVQAIDRTGSAAQVLVVNGQGLVEPRQVAVGLETADRVEVRTGLHDGDMVVVGNRTQLKAGTIVTPSVVDTTTRAEDAR